MIKYKKCRCCGNENIKPWLSLPPTPVANALFKEPNFERYPLDLNYCPDCGHMQLAGAPDPDVVFSEYRYKSGVSNSFKNHFKAYAEYFSGYSIPGKMLEIGSNDGYLLECFKEKGWDVIGVEPSEFLKSEHDAKGIPVVVDFFNTKLVEDKGWTGTFDFIVANNVLAHIPDMHDVMRGISKALKVGGHLVVECGDQEGILNGNFIDNVYHEHIDYYSVHSFSVLAGQYGLYPEFNTRINNHGISFRLVLKKQEYEQTKPDNIDTSKYEDASKIVAGHIEKRKKWFEECLLNQDFIAYGSAAKAVTGLYMLDLVDSNMIGVVDDNELKQNCYFPGTDIMITDPADIDKNAVVLVSAWNVFDDIRNKLLGRGHTGDIICMQ